MVLIWWKSVHYHIQIGWYWLGDMKDILILLINIWNDFNFVKGCSHHIQETKI